MCCSLGQAGWTATAVSFISLLARQYTLQGVPITIARAIAYDVVGVTTSCRTPSRSKKWSDYGLTSPTGSYAYETYYWILSLEALEKIFLTSCETNPQALAFKVAPKSGTESLGSRLTSSLASPTLVACETS